ncbi:MAG: hypothetical protein WCO86_01670, partial [Planctomycetota bacterium]
MLTVKNRLTSAGKCRSPKSTVDVSRGKTALEITLSQINYTHSGPAAKYIVKLLLGEGSSVNKLVPSFLVDIRRRKPPLAAIVDQYRTVAKLRDLLP